MAAEYERDKPEMFTPDLVAKDTLALLDQNRVFATRSDEIKKWLGRVLSEWEDSGALYGETAIAILAVLETCLPISNNNLSTPFPNPSELVKTIESRWD